MESCQSRSGSHKTTSRLPPFSQEQAKWIVSEYAKVKSPTIVRREFRNFFKVTSRKVPHVKEFQRITDRFQKTGNGTPQKPPGHSKTPAEKIFAVKTVLDNSKSPSLSDITAITSNSTYLTWKILRKDLMLLPYKPRLVQKSTP